MEKAESQLQDVLTLVSLVVSRLFFLRSRSHQSARKTECSLPILAMHTGINDPCKRTLTLNQSSKHCPKLSTEAYRLCCNRIFMGLVTCAVKPSQTPDGWEKRNNCFQSQWIHKSGVNFTGCSDEQDCGDLSRAMKNLSKTRSCIQSQHR